MNHAVRCGARDNNKSTKQLVNTFEVIFWSRNKDPWEALVLLRNELYAHQQTETPTVAVEKGD